LKPLLIIAAFFLFILISYRLEMFFIKILKWILIIVFFPLSLLFIAYYKQKKSYPDLYTVQEKDGSIKE